MNRIQLGTVTLTYYPREEEIAVIGKRGKFGRGMLPRDWQAITERFENMDRSTREVAANGIELILWINAKAHRNYTDARAEMWRKEAG